MDILERGKEKVCHVFQKINFTSNFERFNYFYIAKLIYCYYLRFTRYNTSVLITQ